MFNLSLWCGAIYQARVPIDILRESKIKPEIGSRTSQTNERKQNKCVYQTRDLRIKNVVPYIVPSLSEFFHLTFTVEHCAHL